MIAEISSGGVMLRMSKERTSTPPLSALGLQGLREFVLKLLAALPYDVGQCAPFAAFDAGQRSDSGEDDFPQDIVAVPHFVGQHGGVVPGDGILDGSFGFHREAVVGQEVDGVGPRQLHPVALQVDGDDVETIRVQVICPRVECPDYYPFFAVPHRERVHVLRFSVERVFTNKSTKYRGFCKSQGP